MALINPKIVEAAMWPITNWKQREARARRVLKAASENVPDEVVNVALDAWYLTDDWRTEFSKELLEAVRTEMRAALSAGLAKWAEGE
jgi:hypothetical protein